MDFAAEGFFEGLDDQVRAEREELLAWLRTEGFSDDQLRRAHRRGLLVFLAAEREVGGEPRHTYEEISEQSGVPLDLLLQLRRAQGLPLPDPGAVELTDVDLAAAHTSQGFLDVGLNEEQMIATSRALGRGLSITAEAMRAVMLELVLSPGTTELELAQRYATAVHEVMPRVGPLVLQMLSQHLRNMVQGEMAGAAERATGRPPGARDQAIAFADLVGFTRLGEQIAPEDLGTVATRLEALTREVITPPVRLVKTIGDAVLLTADDPSALVETGLALVDASDAEGARTAFPQLRVGLAYGPAVARGGDVFGRAVNLASRVTAIARAGSVLATREIRDATPDDFRWSSANARRIKGLPDPVPLYRARSRAEGS